MFLNHIDSVFDIFEKVCKVSVGLPLLVLGHNLFYLMVLWNLFGLMLAMEMFNKLQSRQPADMSSTYKCARVAYC